MFRSVHEKMIGTPNKSPQCSTSKPRAARVSAKAMPVERWESAASAGAKPERIYIIIKQWVYTYGLDQGNGVLYKFQKFNPYMHDQWWRDISPKDLATTFSRRFQPVEFLHLHRLHCKGAWWIDNLCEIQFRSIRIYIIGWTPNLSWKETLIVHCAFQFDDWSHNSRACCVYIYMVLWCLDLSFKLKFFLFELCSFISYKAQSILKSGATPNTRGCCNGLCHDHTDHWSGPRMSYCFWPNAYKLTDHMSKWSIRSIWNQRFFPSG